MNTEKLHNFYPPGCLQSRVGRGATVVEIAAVMAALCQEVNAALSPIIGERGVAALHQSSHDFCASSRAWRLSHPDALSASVSPGIELLVALQAQRDPGGALNVGEAYLETFYNLLVSLIGPSLTERLLITVWPSSAYSGT